MLPIVNFIGSCIQGIILRQQLIWKNAISLNKLSLPSITSDIKGEVVVSDGLTHGRTFNTRGVIISFVHRHISGDCEVWVLSGHGNVLWHVASCAICLVQTTCDLSAIIFIDEDVHFAHFDGHGWIGAYIYWSQDPNSNWQHGIHLFRPRRGDILNMCLTVPNHSHRKIIIESRWKIRSSSGVRNCCRLSPAFEAILHGNSTFDVGRKREVPWSYCIHLEDSKFISGQGSGAASLVQTTVLNRAVSWFNVCVNVQVTGELLSDNSFVIFTISKSLIWIQSIELSITPRARRTCTS